MTPLRRLIDDFLAPDRVERDFAEVEHLMAGASRLLDVTSVLAAEINPNKILQRITCEACSALRCERASLYQYDPIRDELYTSAVTELEIEEIRRSLDQGITGYAARHRVVVNVPDPRHDARWSSEYDERTGFHTRSIIAAPLVAAHDGSLIGVLELFNREGRAFDQVDEELLTAFSQHAAVALDRARLVEKLQQQQAVQASLDVARQIQRGFMPQILPEVPRYNAATWWLPNEAVGGDYCDVVRLKNGRIGLVIADVSGHGLGPSLIMASVRAALHALVLEHTAPEVLLNLLGRALNHNMPEGCFITMVLAVLNPADNSIEYANAGHAPALHYEAATGEFTPLESTGLPLGVVEHPAYPQGWPLELEPGDLLILGTDGIVESRDRYDRPFGRHRLEHLIRQHARQRASDIAAHIGRTVENYFVGPAPPDDLTLLILQRNRV